MQEHFTRFSKAVPLLVRRYLGSGGGERIEYTDRGETCDTLEKIQEHFYRTGNVKVWTGGSDNTIFDSAAVNWHFRAWHDYHHIRLNLPFTFEGEKQTAREQIRDVYWMFPVEVAEQFARLIWAEVVGQAEHFEKHGVFPVEQKAFIEAYLGNPKVALMRKF